MLLTLTLTSHDPAVPATELGYLLHKHPGRLQTFELGFGQVHIFYPEVDATRCTAALLLDVDPVGLSRSKSGAPENRPLWPYVNDRPYVASSFLSVALSRTLGTALGGRCETRPALAATPLDFTAVIAALATHAPHWVAALFEPLGYTVGVDFDPAGVASVTLQGKVRLSALLNHLYVLVPVLDREKHYWVDEREVEKLLRHGRGWLEAHPEREMIVRRYLKFHRVLARDALSALSALDAASASAEHVAPNPESAPALSEEATEPRDEAPSESADMPEARREASIRLDDRRRAAVLEVLLAVGARTVVDLGCGEGKLIRALLAEPSFTEIVGVDVSHGVLRRAADRLGLDRMPETKRSRVQLVHGSAVYRDDRLRGRDAVICVEVIEHIDPERLDAFRDAVFSHLKPPTVIITTPNVEYNALFREAGRRHADHRFEWTRAEFEAWASHAADDAGYTVRFAPIGELHPMLGPPTQMAVFTAGEAHAH